MLSTLDEKKENTLPITNISILFIVVKAIVYLEEKVAPIARICEFCGCTTTPTWRRGPSGKGSLCNACGIKWRLKGKDSIIKKPPKISVPSHSPDLYKMQRKKKLEYSDPIAPLSLDYEKGYFCKYCKKTWPQSSFKNSQQFGAHCSNCSRKPRGEIEALMSLKKKMPGAKKRSKDMMYDDDGAVPLWEMGRYGKSYGSQNPLLSRILNIVENQIIEPNELVLIKEEVENMKSDLISRKKRRVEQLNSSILKINSEMSDMKNNVEEHIKNRDSKKRSFIDDLKREIDQRIQEKEYMFSSDSLSHTVPIPRGSLSPSLLKEPLSPELIHSPPYLSTSASSTSSNEFYRDQQGKLFSI
eukprot:gene10925-12732_t